MRSLLACGLRVFCPHLKTNMTDKIFSNIPVPVLAERIPLEPKYPFAKLKIGDAFFELPKADESIEKALKRVSGAAANQRKKFPLSKFKSYITTEPDTSQPAVGTWRVADREIAE